MRRAALYLRVSTSEQTCTNQLDALTEAAARHGWNITEVFEDQGISGAKGRDQRPAFDKLLKAVARKEIDIVAAWSVDRLGRSLQGLVQFLDELRAKGVDLYLHQQGLDTSTPTGRAMFGMCSIFAELERSLIQERVRAGLARAVARGAKLGRPQISTRKKRSIREAKAEGLSIRQIAARCSVSVGTVHNALKG